MRCRQQAQHRLSYTQSRQRMEARGHLHAQPAVTSGKSPCTHRLGGRVAPDLVLTFFLGGGGVCPYLDWNPASSNQYPNRYCHYTIPTPDHCSYTSFPFLKPFDVGIIIIEVFAANSSRPASRRLAQPSHTRARL
jgi:hypothetical protein